MTACLEARRNGPFMASGSGRCHSETMRTASWWSPALLVLALVIGLTAVIVKRWWLAATAVVGPPPGSATPSSRERSARRHGRAGRHRAYGGREGDEPARGGDLQALRGRAELVSSMLN